MTSPQNTSDKSKTEAAPAPAKKDEQGKSPQTQTTPELKTGNDKR